MKEKNAINEILATPDFEEKVRELAWNIVDGKLSEKISNGKLDENQIQESLEQFMSDLGIVR